MKLKFGFGLAMMLVCNMAFANYAPLDSVAPDNWFNMDYSADGVKGVSTEVAYNTLLKGKTGRTVVVAVIDSGVDVEHEDLKDIMWVNADEIPGNGIDDDGNGYIDDIHGWNFIGGAKGNVGADNLEITRLYRDLNAEFDGKTKEDIKGKKSKKRYARYLSIKEDFDKASKRAVGQYNQMKTVAAVVDLIVKKLDGKDMNKENVNEIKENGTDKEKEAAEMVGMFLERGATEADLMEIGDYVESSKSGAEYYYNPEFDPRSIVGDNYRDSYERGYGNNDYQGPEASHGTHVAGIIGAVRNNEVGMNGVANNVRIMTIRCVPDGDERDKDVANSIIYAVDNGASVINMSFGKGYSYDEKAVEKAIKYAKKKDVLLVHAAGNSAQNNDNSNNFPNDLLGRRDKEAPNWIEVGASNWGKDGKALATFSNYGKEQIDVFAPGVDLYATVPESKYRSMSGTSMASPVVAGVSAVLRSYYPELTAAQVKEIIMESAITVSEEVNMPGSKDKMVKLSEISKTGGLVNVVEAVKLAEKTKGKKKVKKP